MRLSDSGRALIQGFEGLMLKAYPDAGGYSIGYGHFLGKDPSLASRTITREEADRLFDADVAKFELAVSTTTPDAAQHQFDAMTSLAYNVGTAGFAGSTVARRHNLGDFQGAADAFLMWNKETKGGVKVENPVLTKRRQKERSIYLAGYSAAGSFPAPPQTSTPAVEPSPSASTGWPDTPSSAPAKASIAGLLAVALGWFVYRLVHR